MDSQTFSQISSLRCLPETPCSLGPVDGRTWLALWTAPRKRWQNWCSTHYRTKWWRCLWMCRWTHKTRVPPHTCGSVCHGDMLMPLLLCRSFPPTELALPAARTWALLSTPPLARSWPPTQHCSSRRRRLVSDQGAWVTVQWHPIESTEGLPSSAWG